MGRRAGRYGDGRLGDVLVLGLGKSGKSTVRYLVDLLGTRVERIFIAAGGQNADSQSFVESFAGENVAFAFGDDALVGLDRHFDLCIASPGIPYWHDLYQGATRISDELVSEVEFAWRESAPESTWIAITGTNGKTTTTSLAAHVLAECGFDAAAVGNIGEVCLDAVAAGETDVYVAEVSSYQLYSTRFFAPDIAVMLNITPDHIHWHKTLEAYRDAKYNVLRNVEGAFDAAPDAKLHSPQVSCVTLDAESVDDGRSLSRTEASRPTARLMVPLAILDATNDVVRVKVRELKAQGANYIPLGTADGIEGDMRARCGAENAAFLNSNRMLTVAYRGEEHMLACADDLQIKGAHNVSNALAAAAIAVALGAPDADIARALASFEPLVHRIEPCGSVNGVECFNDSKATNVDATCKALGAFPGRRVIVLLGGDDKGTDLSELIACTHEHACVAVCFGAAGPRFADAFASSAESAPEGFDLLQAARLEDALDTALASAQPGDVVLLSPACASFDEFTSFEQRGDVFKQLVSVRAEQCAR